MQRKLINALAILVIVAGTGNAFAARHQGVRASGGRCSSGDGTVSCDCGGKCWADATSCGCFNE
jgi:hypothetical protein